MVGRLTTHVIDTAHGRPAEGMRIDLYRLDAPGMRSLIKEVTIGADGRADGPLLEAAELVSATYELVFHVGAYFPGAFYGMVPVRFDVHDTNAHYHVPLLVSPWSYTTYRGS